MGRKLLLGLLVLPVIGVWLAAHWPAIHFAKVEASEVMSHFGAPLFFALLIERAVEVFLMTWRSEGSYEKEATVKRLIKEGKTPNDNELKKAQEELIKYKVETQQWALPCTFFLGLLIAILGVRVIEQFLEIPPPGAPGSLCEWQANGLHFVDIILTAALLAGGADPIHKVMDVFRKFMEASSAKASGTNNS
ncbi:MAG: hypothetical protein ACU843_03170 [Gammaproteobacteria bacterium]